MSGSDFWSRRKAAVEAEETALIVEEQEAEIEDISDEDLLEELGLPDPDALEAGDDFTGFMAQAVPARLRNRALRRLWISNPTLANLDELVDYGQDFTDSATVVENMQTAYQVGKGMLSHVQEMARQAEAALAQADSDEPEDLAVCEDADFEPDGPDTDERCETKVVETSATISTDDDLGEMQTARPRRMRFSFETERA